jgi:hypothetical protein
MNQYCPDVLAQRIRQPRHTGARDVAQTRRGLLSEPQRLG